MRMADSGAGAGDWGGRRGERGKGKGDFDGAAGRSCSIPAF